MKRRRAYKQNNPRDQALVLLMSIEGTVSNLRDGVYGTLTRFGRIKTKFLEEQLARTRELVNNLPEGEWEPPMNRSHSTHSYPNDKPVPKSATRNLTPTGKRTVKRQHNKRARAASRKAERAR
jgi:hypothetical protein